TPDRRSSFWTAAPTIAVNGETNFSADHPAAPCALQAIGLPSGVLLLVPAARAIHADDLEAIHSAAAPLLKLLEKRRLVDARHERETEGRRCRSCPTKKPLASSPSPIRTPAAGPSPRRKATCRYTRWTFARTWTVWCRTSR